MKNKSRYIALVLIILMITAFLTNPPREKHEEIIRDKAKQILKEQLSYKHQDAFDFGMQLFGDQMINQFMKGSVQIDNYFLFSTTKVRWENKQTVIGIGAFGKVWLSSKIDEKIADIINVLKKI
ncbi:Uncharacterised protein [Sphingobacterium spiritivorum]|uniref:DUF4359 domain-containing protein n=1 Tax=Sphingobacterium spiritivorum TaxID=258 RepID=A0A380C8X6_SPHSI|nr:DUF4359 domain-containing protein [Sphingobacterium spiritivorum]SUJ15326.1 Uncharacterised protein [Sphingobacterium spiritivorum]